MVDKSTTSPLLPGWAWLAATVLAVPAFTGLILAAADAIFGRLDDVPALGWVALGTLVVGLAAAAFSRLPRLRAMSGAARAIWSLAGAALGAALTAPWAFALFLAFLYAACHSHACFD